MTLTVCSAEGVHWVARGGSPGSRCGRLACRAFQQRDWPACGAPCSLQPRLLWVRHCGGPQGSPHGAPQALQVCCLLQVGLFLSTHLHSLAGRPHTRLMVWALSCCTPARSSRFAIIRALGRDAAAQAADLVITLHVDQLGCGINCHDNSFNCIL